MFSTLYLEAAYSDTSSDDPSGAVHPLLYSCHPTPQHVDSPLTGYRFLYQYGIDVIARRHFIPALLGVYCCESDGVQS